MTGKLYSVYILTNYTKSVLYTGVTGEELKLRIYQHKAKVGSSFTSTYKVNKLVYYEIHEDPKEAIKREKQIKNLLRSKKIAMINRFNPSWTDLYVDL